MRLGLNSMHCFYGGLKFGDGLDVTAEENATVEPKGETKKLHFAIAS